MPQIESAQEAEWLRGKIESGATNDPNIIAALADWDASDVNAGPEVQQQAAELKEGVIQEEAGASLSPAQAAEESLGVKVETTNQLLSAAEVNPGEEFPTVQEVWDNMSGSEKFLVGIGSGMNWVVDAGLNLFDDEDDRREAEAMVYEEMDAQQIGIEDLGDVAGMLVGGMGAKAAAAPVGLAIGLANGIRKGAQAVKAIRNGNGMGKLVEGLYSTFKKYHPKTIEKVVKSKEGQNLVKTSRKGEQAAEASVNGLTKRMDNIDDAVRQQEAVMANAAAKRLAAQKDAAFKIRQQELQKAKDLANNVQESTKAINKYNADKTLGVREGAKRYQQDKIKEALKRSPGGF